MADNSTKIVLTAEDKASAVLASVSGNLGRLESVANTAARALGAIGVTLSAAAMVAMVKGTIDAADGFNDLSQRIGITVRDLAGWKLAADQSGTSIEAVAKGVKGLSGYMVENGEKLRAAGITATDANGAMIQLAELFSAMPDGIHKTALATQIFGKAGMEMIPMLNMGAAGLEEARKKADEFGRRMAEIAPDADKFNDQIKEMELQSKGLGISIAQHFLPGLIGISQWLIDIKSNGEKAFQAIEWMFGERAARASALLGLGRAGLSQSASGTIGGAKPKGLTAAEEEALGDKNSASLRAMGLLDKTKEGAAGNDTALERMLKKGRENLAASIDSEEELAKIARKREADEARATTERLKHFEELAQAREMELYYATAGEETMREETDKLTAALAKQKTMAQDLGMTFASAFEDAVIGGRGLQSILQGLAQDVARIFLRKQFTEPMANSLSGMFSGMNLFGGDAPPSATGGVDYPSWASGTDYVPADGFAMLHKGEAVIPAARNGGSGQAIRVEVVNPPGRPAEVASATPRMDVDGMVVRVVLRDIATGGAIAGAMAQQFGLNRAAGAY